MRQLPIAAGIDTAATMPPRPGGLSGSHAFLPAILFLLVLLPPLPSDANEISMLAGATEGIEEGDGSYAWQVGFRYNFLRNFSASLSWINEGHLEEHKRDGFGMQGWGRLPLLGNRLAIGVGAGIYRFFDTKLSSGGSHENGHGWAPIYSFAAMYYTETPWFAQVTVNHIHPDTDFNSNTYLIGVGYRLWKDAPPRSDPGPADPPAMTTGYELMPFLGQVVVNKPGNDPGVGTGIEFRMGIDEHLDWTVTWLNEDVPGAFHRTGLGTQVWLVDEFLARRITLGFGAGVYSFVDREPTPDTEERERLDFAGLFTVTASYRFSDRWFTRFNWNRVMSSDNRDTDMFLLGLGYRWER